MKAIAIIPARMGSTRFPGKALADETGKPMVVHVCEQASKAESVDRVVVAADSQEIIDAVKAHGFEAVMTSTEHPNGTSRLAEAAKILKLKKNQVVVNVQGDEPEIEPEILQGAVDALNLKYQKCNRDYWISAGNYGVGTVISPMEKDSAAQNPNVVKAVIGLIEPDHAIAPVLYFSRATIPLDREGDSGVSRFRHVGIYAYAASVLWEYPQLHSTPNESAELLEQLRWLEHGYAMHAAVRPSSHTGIDTPEQYRAFVERYRATNS